MPLLKVGESLKPINGQPRILREKNPEIWTTLSKNLSKTFGQGSQMRKKYQKNFFQEVYMCEGEYLYVGGKINYQGALTTPWRG